MTDIASLSLRVDSSQVKVANVDLRNLAVTSDKTEKSVSSFTSKSSASFASMARSIGLVTIAVGAITGTITKSIGSASRFETALVGVAKTTGLAGQELDDFANRIDRISRSIPVSTDELLELSQAAGQMGVSGSENLEKFAVTVAKLGRASDLAGEQAASALARILNVTNENVGSIDTLASVIVSLGNNVAATESQIARMTTEIARSTSVFGVSSAEAAAMGAAMASIGIQAEIGGSSVGRVMQEITSRVQEGGNSLTDFADTLNLNSDTLTKLFQDDKVAAFQFFLEAVGDLGLDAGNALKSVGLGGQEIAKTIIPLSNNMGIFTETLRLANAEVANATALDREYEASLGTLSTQWQVTKNIVESYARSIGEVLVPALNQGLVALNNFFGAGEDNDPIQKQVKLIEDLDAKIQKLKGRNTGLDGVIPGASKIFGTNKRDLDQLKSDRENSIEDLFKMIDAQKKLAIESNNASKAIRPLVDQVQDVGTSSNKASDEVEKLSETIGGITIEQIKQQESTKRIIDLNSKVESITASVATEQEKYNATLKELDELKPYLSVETYTRALEKAEDELRDVEDTTRQVTSQVDQLWIQAGRSIQSTLATSIFNFIDDGFKGVVNNVKTAVGRIASEFAALKLAQGIGLTSLFGGVGGGAAQTSSSLNLAGIGSSLIGGVSSVRNLLTGGGSAFAAGSGGAGTAFIGGPGTAIGGSGTGAAGLTLGTGGLVLGAAFATSEINRLIANDNKIAGVNSDTLNKFINPLSQIPIIGDFIPDIGGILTGIFGRGELKQQETNLIGDFNSEGFEGVTSVKFKAKGGLVRGSKVDRVINDTDSGELLNGFRGLSESGISSALSQVATEAGKAAVQLGEFLDNSITGFSESLRSAAENLGISTDSIDNFSTSINIASEKGEALSEAQIAEVLADVSNELSTGLIPEIEELARTGETAFTAISRINSEFDSLTNIMLLLGRNTEEAKNELRGLSITQRTELIDQLGGVQNANASFDSFFNNFLSPEDQLEILSDQLLSELQKVDINRIVSPEEVAEAFKANSLSTDQLAAALSLPMQSLILAVDGLKTSAEEAALSVEKIEPEIIKEFSLNAVNDSFGALSKSIASEQKTIAEEITEVSRRMNDLSGVLRSAGSAINTINPVTKFAATTLIQEAINDSDFKDPRLGNAITALTKSSADGFSTRADFLRDQADSASTLRELEDAAGNQLTIEEQTLSALESESEQLSGILSNAQLQLDAISGVDNSIQSLADALLSFNTQSVAAGGGAVAEQGGSVPFNGNPNISGDLIRDFFSVPRTDQEIIAEQARTGVSSDQILASTDFTERDRQEFFARTQVPFFASGGTHTGGLRVVGEDGPELEFTQPSRIVSNSDSKKLLDNSEVVDLLKKVLEAVENGVKPSQDTYNLLRRMTDDGQSLKTKAA